MSPRMCLRLDSRLDVCIPPLREDSGFTDRCEYICHSYRVASLEIRDCHGAVGQDLQLTVF